MAYTLKKTSLARFITKTAVLALLPCVLLIVMVSGLGRAAPSTRQIYFIGAGRGRPGMVTLDMDRNIFARFEWQVPLRSVADWAWSPDGQQLVFRVTRNISVDLLAMDSGGGNLNWLTLDGRNNHAPAWSPDGRSIAFTSERDGNPEIYVIDADGSNPRRLTDHPAADDAPAWSPDSQSITFQSRRDGDYEIYAMDVDGNNLRRLTVSASRDVEPSWSPDGQQIAFVSDRDSNYEVYRIDAACHSRSEGCNSLAQRLTYTKEFEFTPHWSPDGVYILFEAMSAGSDVVTYVMDGDGGNLRRLTTIEMRLQNPLWRGGV
jgi:Tol biopolymer transport system component